QTSDRSGPQTGHRRGHIMRNRWKRAVTALALMQAVSGCSFKYVGQGCSGLSGDELAECQLTNLFIMLGLAGLVGGLIASPHHHSHQVPPTFRPAEAAPRTANRDPHGRLPDATTSVQRG